MIKKSNSRNSIVSVNDFQTEFEINGKKPFVDIKYFNSKNNIFLFLNSTDIPTKQVPETKYAILSYILKLRIKRACRTVSFHAVFYMFSGKEQGGWEKGLLLPCQDGTFLLIEFQKYKSKKYLRQ